MIENEFELNGKRYVAKYFAVDGIAACDGCAFNNDDPLNFSCFAVPTCERTGGPLFSLKYRNRNRKRTATGSGE